MSVDSGTGPAAGAGTVRGLGCSLCERDPDATALVVACYPEDGCESPAVAASDGLVGVCEDCAGEVAELVDAWDGHAAPPVGADHSIGEGYRRVAEDCSFCADAVGDAPLLGVEYYRPTDDVHDGSRDDGDDSRGDDEPPAEYANYSLCENCRPVFDEFLRGVSEDATA